MPELPEVETMCRGIASVVGLTIQRLGRMPCQRRPIAITPKLSAWETRVVGQSISEVVRVGKRVVLRLANDERIVFEPRMTGLVLLTDPPTVEHLRFELGLSHRGREITLQYWDRRGLGSIRLYSGAEFAAWLDSGRLGPDALSVGESAFRACFASSRQPIKVALLDQRRLAGVGNLYASELLFMAAVDPRVRCDQIQSSQWRAIYRAMRRVLLTAIRYEGSTLSDGTYRTALNQSGRYQNHHRVYDREGETCPRCRSEILRIVQAQRATFFCAVCQLESEKDG